MLPENTTVDDAVHILDWDMKRTLCGNPITRGQNVTHFHGPQPGSGDGCWTCMKAREDLIAREKGDQRAL